MIPVLEAQRRLIGAAPAPVAERVALPEAYGRVLAEDVVASEDVPAWRASAMDGYAVRAADVGTDGAALPLRGRVLAGGWPDGPLAPGCAALVMTGAPVPEGADAVVPFEQSDRALEGEVRLTAGTAPGRNVRPVGSDVRTGAVVARAGEVLSPPVVALLASVGRKEVQVAKQPVVVVVTTGDEVVREGLLRPGQLRSSNHLALLGLVREAGGVALDGGHAADDPRALREVFGAALAAGDVVVSTGGVSAGTADLVRPTWAALGAVELLYKVRMKPGMPVLAARWQGDGRAAVLVGLPGNPVSAVVTFQQLVRPLIRVALGDPRPFLPVLQVRAGEDMPSAPGRARFERVSLRWDDGAWVVTRPRDQSSHVLSGLAEAEAWLVLGPDSPGLREGEIGLAQPVGGALPARATPGFEA